MYNDESTKISASGLRYLVKENGTPFQAMGAPGETRSCIKCGKHKARSKGSIQRYLNSLMFFCFDCRPVKKSNEKK
ncbi:MAG: hypothetical protein CO105_02050 [Comamonadaceae bacterium CG_4_9_14_3_um_filter_60_33]|nr:MAG: hypothetical protein AUK51_01460 [Comamonadaceae bacterium CG2_30_59_20]PIY28061.1 MAG: hypothetical protein COZ09_11905 [Comamonadaceae bacterium CG_4_10_14_3_um_filter_60_42]PJB46304.1 MAG: hypothetical protein CO105_02050 [Comamonadaceae bacterium CG_4_9_14_3_um_filter_60_33]